MKKYGHMAPIKIGKRIVPNKQLLGVEGYDAFHLRERQIIEVLDIDKYGRGLVKIENKECWVWAKIIDQISNEVKE